MTSTRVQPASHPVVLPTEFASEYEASRDLAAT